MRSALFWDVTQRLVVIVYRRFGTTYRSLLQGLKAKKKSPRKKLFLLGLLTLEDEKNMLSQKSTNNYYATLSNIPEELRPQRLMF
jgi:hypothetical protein